MFLRVEVVNGVRHDVPRVDRLLQRVGDARHRHRPPEPILSTAKKVKGCITRNSRIWFFGRLPDIRQEIGRRRISGRVKPHINFTKLSLVQPDPDIRTTLLTVFTRLADPHHKNPDPTSWDIKFHQNFKFFNVYILLTKSYNYDTDSHFYCGL